MVNIPQLPDLRIPLAYRYTPVLDAGAPTGASGFSIAGGSNLQKLTSSGGVQNFVAVSILLAPNAWYGFRRGFPTTGNEWRAGALVRLKNGNLRYRYLYCTNTNFGTANIVNVYIAGWEGPAVENGWAYAPPTPARYLTSINGGGAGANINTMGPVLASDYSGMSFVSSNIVFGGASKRHLVSSEGEYTERTGPFIGNIQMQPLLGWSQAAGNNVHVPSRTLQGDIWYAFFQKGTTLRTVPQWAPVEDNGVVMTSVSMTLLGDAALDAAFNNPNNAGGLPVDWQVVKGGVLANVILAAPQPGHGVRTIFIDEQIRFWRNIIVEPQDAITTFTMSTTNFRLSQDAQGVYYGVRVGLNSGDLRVSVSPPEKKFVEAVYAPLPKYRSYDTPYGLARE